MLLAVYMSEHFVLVHHLSILSTIHSFSTETLYSSVVLLTEVVTQMRFSKDCKRLYSVSGDR